MRFQSHHTHTTNDFTPVQQSTDRSKLDHTTVVGSQVCTEAPNMGTANCVYDGPQLNVNTYTIQESGVKAISPRLPSISGFCCVDIPMLKCDCLSLPCWLNEVWLALVLR